MAALAQPIYERQGAFAYGHAGPPERRLRYVDAGAGPMLLFVHGFPSFWYCWQRQLEALQSDHRVVAIDALGAGGSSKPADDAAYRLPLLADDIDRVADTLGAERFVLIGHDWGSALAFAYAQARPQRLHGVIGLSAPPFNQFLDLVATDPDQRARSVYMDRLRALTRERIAAESLAPLIAGGAYGGLAERGMIDADDFSLFRRVVGDPEALLGGSAWYRANLPAFDAIAPEHYWPVGDSPLAIPSLLIWGEADETFVPTFPEDFAARHPRSEVLRLPGVGHWTMLEAPEAVTAAIARFVARVTA